MKIIKITIAALLVLAVAALAGVGRPEAAGGASDDARQGITVTGTGHVKAVPDEAEFSLGVTTKGSTARAALSENSAQMQRLIAALKAAGVAREDIKTQDVSVGQSYEGSGQPSGYSAHNTVSVRIRDLDRAGAVLDAAARAGANNVYGPSLSRSDREGLEAKALKDAVANARNRAKALAEAAGVSLGEVTAIAESSQPQPGPFYEMAGRAVAADAKAPIEPGTEEITAVVTVTFALGS
jgi:uncharacterized protein YggE